MATGRSDGQHGDYYDVLGVPDTATGDDIVRAYRRLAREHHPDRNPAAGSARFQQITDAYGVIGDADRRRAYDATRSGAMPPGARRIPVNHGPAPAQAPGTAARAVIELSTQEAAEGAIVAVEVVERAPCGVCDGSGLEQPAPGSVCPACGGSGSRTRRTGQLPVRYVCRECAGRGRPSPRACLTCNGSGIVSNRRPVKARIPPGVRDGATVRIPRPAPAADIYAVVRVIPLCNHWGK